MKKFIIAEGPNDRAIIGQLLKYHRIDTPIFNDKVAGIDNILKGIPIYLKPGSEGIYAIVIDADSPLPDPQKQFMARWQSVQYQLNKCGYDVPKLIPDEGLILDHEECPRVGIWMMPDNKRRGAIEDFIEDLVNPNDILWPHVTSVLESLPETRFVERRKMKATLHTWLAWQSEPGCSPEQALMKKLLDPNAETATKFVKWIADLFDENQ